MKLNYFGLVAAVLAFASLALPWLTVSSNAVSENINMEFTVYLYQIQGIINGLSATTVANVWFVWGAMALVVITAISCLVGSALAGRRGQLLLLVAGILALIAVVEFGAGLLSSDYANPELEPACVMNLFPHNIFGITAETAMLYGYDFVWWLNYGFWLAIAAAVISFVGAVAPSLLKKPAVIAREPKTAQSSL